MYNICKYGPYSNIFVSSRHIKYKRKNSPIEVKSKKNIFKKFKLSRLGFSVNAFQNFLKLSNRTNKLGFFKKQKLITKKRLLLLSNLFFKNWKKVIPVHYKRAEHRVLLKRTQDIFFLFKLYGKLTSKIIKRFQAFFSYKKFLSFLFTKDKVNPAKLYRIKSAFLLKRVMATLYIKRRWWWRARNRLGALSVVYDAIVGKLFGYTKYARLDILKYLHQINPWTGFTPRNPFFLFKKNNKFLHILKYDLARNVKTKTTKNVDFAVYEKNFFVFNAKKRRKFFFHNTKFTYSLVFSASRGNYFVTLTKRSGEVVMVLSSGKLHVKTSRKRRAFQTYEQLIYRLSSILRDKKINALHSVKFKLSKYQMRNPITYKHISYFEKNFRNVKKGRLLIIVNVPHSLGNRGSKLKRK